MWTKKIEIKDENHLKEVVEALKSVGGRMWGKHYEYPSVKSFWYDDVDNCWYTDNKSIDKFESDKDVPEYEIITKTSYELKEVKKFKVTCKNCGKTVEYKDSNDMFEDFVIFKGSIDFGNQVITYLENKTVCKDCIMSLVDNWN